MGSHARFRADRGRALVSATGLLAASAITVAALLATRPALSGRPESWRGDDLAIATAWLVALVCAAWLLLSTVACLAALTSGRTAAAHRFAASAPPVARWILQTAIIGTSVLVPGTAYAVTPTTPAPLVVHVDRHGRIAPTEGNGLARIPRSVEAPVVRAPSAPRARPVTTTTVASRATVVERAPTPPAPIPRSNPPRDSPVAPVASPLAPRSTGRYVVRAGDSLWGIARTEVARTDVARANGAPADEPAIARYWLRVVAANRATLRSGNPSLIFPGEIVTLP